MSAYDNDPQDKGGVMADWGSVRPQYQANYAQLTSDNLQRLRAGVLISLTLNTGAWITAASANDQIPDLLLTDEVLNEVEVAQTPLWVTVSGMREQIKLLGPDC